MPKNKKTEIKKTEAIKVNKKETQPINKAPGKFTKKAKIILFSTLGVVAIAGASVGIYFASSSNQTKDNKATVKLPSIVGLTFSNKTAKIGEDYVTDLTIDSSAEYSILPDALNYVKSSDKKLTTNDYTYVVATNKKSGKLTIPSKFVVDTIALDLNLISTKPEPVKVNVIYPNINGFTPSKKTAYLGEKFITTLSVDTKTTGRNVLPSNKEDITIVSGESPITDFTYNRDDSGESASLIILGEYITDIITIDFELEAREPDPTKEVVVQYPQFMGFTVTETLVEPGADYYATLKIDESAHCFLPNTVNLTVGGRKPVSGYRYEAITPKLEYSLYIPGKITGGLYLPLICEFDFICDPTIAYIYPYTEGHSTVGFDITTTSSKVITISWGDGEVIQKTTTDSESVNRFAHEYDYSDDPYYIEICGDIAAFNVSCVNDPLNPQPEYIFPGNQHFLFMFLNKNLDENYISTLAGPAYYLPNSETGIITPYESDDTHKSELTYVSVGAEVTHIPPCAFACCNEEANITVGQNIESIGHMAFYDCCCDAIPQSVRRIGQYSFAEIDDAMVCVMLTSNHNLLIIDAYAFKGSKIQRIDIPSSVEEIGQHAFDSSFSEYSDEPIRFTNDSHLSFLGKEAFSNSGLRGDITLPASLCEGIVEEKVFSGCDDYLQIHVPYVQGQQPNTWSNNWSEGIPDPTNQIIYLQAN